MKCEWDRAWIGPCENEVTNGQFCDEHRRKCVSCGGEATHDCSTTLGPLVCGQPLCGSCSCPSDKAWKTARNGTTQHPTIRIEANGHVATPDEMQVAFDLALRFVAQHPEPVGGWQTSITSDGDARVRVFWQDGEIIAHMRIRRDHGVL
jgi:hypothetical protein